MKTNIRDENDSTILCRVTPSEAQLMGLIGATLKAEEGTMNII